MTIPRRNYFSEHDYIRTCIKSGVSRNRSGTRIIALSSDFLIGFHRTLEHECGPAAADILKLCGIKWGRSFARRLDQELSEYYGEPVQQMTMATFLALLSEAFSHHGFGLLSVDLAHHQTGLLPVELRSPLMGTMRPNPAQPSEAMIAGVLASLFGHFANQTLDCIQTACVGMGAPVSTFVVGLEARLTQVPDWVAAGVSHAEILQRLASSRI